MKSYTWRAGILTSDLASTTRLVLLTLSCHVNDAGESAFPSTKLLASESGLSERAVVSHLAIAKEKGWLRVQRHGFGGQRWARHEYYPSFPKGAECGSAASEEGTESGSVPWREGTEPDDEKALKEVQSNYSGELPGYKKGGGGREHQGSDPPPSKAEEKIDLEVKRIEKLHLRTCGLNTLPPVAIVREILRRGVPPAVIDDVYQAHGGDVQRYRQRNIVERLQAIRDGERSPPGRGHGRHGGLSAAERRQQATVDAARDFVGGGDDGGG